MNAFLNVFTMFSVLEIDFEKKFFNIVYDYIHKHMKLLTSLRLIYEKVDPIFDQILTKKNSKKVLF